MERSLRGELALDIERVERRRGRGGRALANALNNVHITALQEGHQLSLQKQEQISKTRLPNA